MGNENAHMFARAARAVSGTETDDLFDLCMLKYTQKIIISTLANIQ